MVVVMADYRFEPTADLQNDNCYRVYTRTPVAFLGYVWRTGTNPAVYRWHSERADGRVPSPPPSVARVAAADKLR